ncbi:Rossmann-like and DUF2520 domain-containing protein [Dyadobacter sediminis]|uniref:DUF2520 domain-containing protein n=1 Tax=Dyadobacter sediminis TaxID=1493691 RepID=A0A5R9K7P7_9BACT|nr:Rossmann-like and DUF2520 domain-containing protein [Dyadobacter sediminis]TLU89887.1 DUF2520 domain-containing protein [Dyadobacter sediminis]GGC12006.1 hypothetical protein GCM10011325_43530 [Dyadobacter sediminis]
MKISFVGSGNVAWHLAQAFEDAGHWICEVYSRDTQKARQLASYLYDTDIQPDLNFSESEAELIVIAVSDDTIESIIERIVLPEGVILVHTSGTRSLAEFQKLVEIYSDVYVHTGVFYPLQTFTKEVEMDYKELPFCIESKNELIENKLIQLAQTVSNNVNRMDSDERFILHVAAVFASNFTNHLLTISHCLLEKEQLKFDLLKPLIQTTFRKALESDDPSLGQTGPAKRGDWKTTGRHLEYLQETDEDWTEIYRLLTDKIRNFYISK